ncbi:MAG: tripartite tricarboxylate transporter substrate binding protein [Proteobacteria bacterium]|nr:tripartite tricarboxylate transporter substrate binding protein [Pseudomonadota bacterium]
MSVLARLTCARRLAAGVLTLLVAAAAPAVAADDWPTRPVRLIVPFPPGGGSDVVARAVAARLGEALGQPVWIDNRPGAGGTLGADLVAHATPDGYTIGLATSSTHPAAVVLQKTVPYDPVTGFAPVALIGTTPYVLIASPQLPAATLRDFIAYVQGRPGKVNFASVGATTLGYLVTRQFMILTDTTTMVHVPYKGSAQIYPDLMSNEVSVEFDNPSGSAALIQSGKLRAYGVTQRSAILPDVPSFAALGVADFDPVFWYGLVGPPGTPAPIVARIGAEVVRFGQSPAGRADLLAKGVEPAAETAPGFGARIAGDIARFKALVERLGIKPE